MEPKCFFRNAIFIGVIGMLGLMACAAHPPGIDTPGNATPGSDPIVGEWKGLGMGAGSAMEFKTDHTCRLYDTEHSSLDSLNGTWKEADGKYLMVMTESGGEASTRSGRIDAKGRLVVTIDLAPGVEFGFEKMGAPPVAAGVQAGKAPAGEWIYAYTSKSGMPAAPAPPYDWIAFLDSKTVRLTDSVRERRLDKPYRISGDTIEIAVGEVVSPKIEFRYRWEEGGAQLVLSIAAQEFGLFDVEWTFLKEDQFIPPEIEGTWTLQMPAEGMNEDWEFAKDLTFYRITRLSDGRVIKPIQKRLHDYYRVWKSPWGKTMTIATYDPSMSMSATQMFNYELDARGLTLTPIYLNEKGERVAADAEKQILTRGTAATLLPEAGQGNLSAEQESAEKRAREILRKCLVFQREMKSFSYEMHTRVAVKMQDNKQTDSREESYVAMESPNRFVLRAPGPREASGDVTQAFCDGKTLIIYQAKTNEFTEEKAPSSVAEIAEAIGFSLLPAGLLGVPSTVPDEQHMATIEEARYLGEEAINGIACHHIAYKQQGGILLGIELWIESGDRPLVLQASPKMINPATEEEVKSVEILITQDHWTLNQPLPDETFKFNPPAGAKKVKEFEAFGL